MKRNAERKAKERAAEAARHPDIQDEAFSLEPPAKAENWPRLSSFP
jgi:hypothetical protein